MPMVTLPYLFPHPSAATYDLEPTPYHAASPLCSGGHYTLPFPYSHGAPPAFPHTATHPPPAARPVNGDPYHAQPAFPCPISAARPSPAYMPPPAPAYAPPPPVPYPPPAQAYAPPPPVLYANAFDCETEHDDGAIPRYDRNFCSNAIHDKFRSSSGDLSKGTNTRGASIHRPTPSTPARVPSTPVTGGRSRTLSWLLDTGRTPSTRERTPLQASFDSVHGELSKLSAAVSQLVVVMGLQTTEALVTDSSSLVASAQFRSPATTASVPSLFCVAASSFVSSPSSPLRASFVEPAAMIASTTATNASMLPAAPAYVASQVFDKMATSSTGHGTQATTPNYCDGHQTPIQSTSMPAGNDKLSEQKLDEMPQSYGFNNLSRQSLFLADGTERSYYVLPEDYPLEQATKPMSPPAEKHVGVMVPPSVAAHAADVAPVLGFKANNTAGYESLLVPNLQLSMKVQDAPNVFKGMPVYDIYEEEDSGSLNITSDVRDFSLELQQQQDEKACNCPVLKASDSVITSSNQLGSEHSMRELRLLWDPGASAIPVNPLNNDNNNDTIESGLKTAYCQMRAKCFIAFGLEWTEVSASVLVVLSVPCSKSTYAAMSNTTCVWDPGIALIYQQSVQMNYIARNLLSSHNYLQILEMDIIFITFLPP